MTELTENFKVVPADIVYAYRVPKTSCKLEELAAHE